MLAVNLRGPILFARAVLPVLRRQRSGTIVNVASQLGKVGIAEYATYCASKFGVVGFTEALADELAQMARGMGRLSRPGGHRHGSSGGRFCR